jgi:hypothetical protein
MLRSVRMKLHGRLSDKQRGPSRRRACISSPRKFRFPLRKDFFNTIGANRSSAKGRLSLDVVEGGLVGRNGGRMGRRRPRMACDEPEGIGSNSTPTMCCIPWSETCFLILAQRRSRVSPQPTSFRCCVRSRIVPRLRRRGGSGNAYRQFSSTLLHRDAPRMIRPPPCRRQ